MAGPRSPDSSISISSLLAKCSLVSSKRSRSSSIEYKDTLYDSASKALEAYIEDFEDSLSSPMASTGKISIHSPATLGSAKKKGASNKNFRPKHLPRRRCASLDPDLLSLTTDDLMDIPSDGTLPFSQVSHWKRSKNLNNHLGHSRSPSSPLTSSLNVRSNLGSSHHNSHPLDLRRLEDLKKNRSNILPDRQNYHYNNLKRSEEPKSYPRWLTSQKSDLSVSGITSIPDVKYPLWIKDYGLLENLTKPAARSTKRNSLRASKAREPFRDERSSSSLDSVHALLYDGRGKEEVNSSSRKSYSGLSDLDVLKHLHTPRKDYTSDSSVQHSEAAALSDELPDNDRSPRTEDVLEGERSWEKIPYTLKSPVPVACEDEMDEELATPLSHDREDFLKDRVKDESKASSFSGGNHHGPVEALKHMLFNLQAFQQNFTQVESEQKAEEFQKVYTEGESEIESVDQEEFPVNKSLQKALQHLSRLKELVGDSTTKLDHENQNI